MHRARAPKGQQVKANTGWNPGDRVPRNILRALKGRTGTFAVVGA
jgi:hypothetical protein